MKPPSQHALIVLVTLAPLFCFSQTIYTATNPNNPSASVSLGWLNDIPRIRYGGNGPGSSYGFQIQGAGDDPKLVVLNSGSIGIGSSSPGSRFSGKVLELSDSRPILKIGSSGTLGTLSFTNTQVNSSTHHGEFHINHEFSSSDATNSLLRFSSYPGGDIMTLSALGNVGIGTTNPDSKLEVLSSVKINDPNNRGSAFLKLDRGTEGRDRALVQFGETNNYYWNVGLLYQGGGTNSNFYISQYDRIRDSDGTFVHTPELMINSIGNVGIGSSNPDSKLTVKGDIHPEEVKVDLSVPGPDYVFEEDYELPTLESIQNYIKSNKHLPEIPSAKEMEENGIDLGVMKMLLLKKVEELTLYTIQQEMKITKLKEEMTYYDGGLDDKIGKLMEHLNEQCAQLQMMNIIIGNQQKEITKLKIK